MKRTFREPQKTILALDPSITAFGWCLFSLDGKPKEAGCIKTAPSPKKLKVRKGDDRVRRIKEINTKLLQIIKGNNVALIVTEQPHGSQSAVSALMIGIVLGVIQTLSDCKSIPVEWYSEGDCKKFVVGKRVASKDEIKTTVSKIYTDIPFTGTGYIDEAIADSVAVYHAACCSSDFLQLLRNLNKMQH